MNIDKAFSKWVKQYADNRRKKSPLFYLTHTSIQATEEAWKQSRIDTLVAIERIINTSQNIEYEVIEYIDTELKKTQDD